MCIQLRSYDLDLDLDPMTLILDLDLDVPGKRTSVSKGIQKLQKNEYRHTDK